VTTVTCPTNVSFIGRCADACSATVNTERAD
jgi:hypothetical protein